MPRTRKQRGGFIASNNVNSLVAKSCSRFVYPTKVKAVMRHAEEDLMPRATKHRLRKSVHRRNNGSRFSRRVYRGRCGGQMRKFHLISGLQAGADRGALLGFDDARNKAGISEQVASTGGFAPLGYKCDDYIQKSVRDTSEDAQRNIEKERKYVKTPLSPLKRYKLEINMRKWIDKFHIVEFENKNHEVKFSAKDKANANEADVLVGFRVNKKSLGAGTEQTINYGLFGEYTFVEQFKNGKTAGGALMRLDFIGKDGWPEDHIRQAKEADYPGAVVFRKNKKYMVWNNFVHATPIDDEKSKQKREKVYTIRPVTQEELLQKQCVKKFAQKSAISFTLDHKTNSKDTQCAEQLAKFLDECAIDGKTLNVMVTGATESNFQGCQERVRKIFANAFTKLFTKLFSALAPPYDWSREVTPRKHTAIDTKANEKVQRNAANEANEANAANALSKVQFRGGKRSRRKNTPKSRQRRR